MGGDGWYSGMAWGVQRILNSDICSSILILQVELL